MSWTWRTQAWFRSTIFLSSSLLLNPQSHVFLWYALFKILVCFFLFRVVKMDRFYPNELKLPLWKRVLQVIGSHHIVNAVDPVNWAPFKISRRRWNQGSNLITFKPIGSLILHSLPITIQHLGNSYSWKFLNFFLWSIHDRKSGWHRSILGSPHYQH